MLSLASEKRNKEEKVDMLRKGGVIPGILYGPKSQPATLKVDGKEFQKVYREAGESSLINLNTGEGVSPVIIRDVQLDPLRGNPIHVDFYQPSLDKPIEIMVPLVFAGEASGVKDLGGTLVKSMQEVEVKALPQNLPHEIEVDISKLVTFEDRILVKDLVRGADVEILNDPDEMVVQVAETEDIEAELEQPVEENVEAVESSKPEKEAKEGEGEEQKEG